MTLEDRIAAFTKLGNYIDAIDEGTLENLLINSRNENSWFTNENVTLALTGIRKFLYADQLAEWTSQYEIQRQPDHTIAVVMAGNIPLVGFHDFLSILISGNKIQIKPSSKDTRLLNHLIEVLIDIEPAFRNRIAIVERLQHFDAVIATGSDNTARYFDYYFSKYPHIIRRNRSSCAILTGFETDEELTTLGLDVFSFFGLGCRNVSKIFIPEHFEFPRLFEAWTSYESIIHHHKYHNNYDYQKSILLVNRVPFLDNGFVILQQNNGMVSPISVLYYEHYSTWDILQTRLDEEKNKIQCIVGNAKPATVRIGSAQSPSLWDYADQIDVLKFLETLR